MDLTPAARDFILLALVWVSLAGALPMLAIALVDLFREFFV